METQDKMLDTIGNTVSTLKAQAGLMGREVLEQVGMLEDLESGVERSQTRLDRASKKMNEFVQKNKSTSATFSLGTPAADIFNRLHIVMDHLPLDNRAFVPTACDYIDLRRVSIVLGVSTTRFIPFQLVCMQFNV